ncbi:Uncharacterised protein [Mycobacteroides abscessus subsp. bolletii]|nr:Uncharacterised protein [Mycobacteroides abscessus subsp. bolletii]SKP62265.1 Uncharacterised protein [Mycobacteroides abscessus subsp. bolletii]SKP73572.1 Uncharacterised protein [Mycobacteroides abscessus subsp. bolletii]SKQ21253.1 Uncharacterised protein [Mycobacteroides abscessus subsp. bolletii]
MTLAEGFLSPPAHIPLNPVASWAITAAAILLTLVAAAYCARETIRTRSALPFTVFASSMTWLPIEAFVDIPMALWHNSDNQLIAMWVLGRPLPLYVASTGGAFFLGAWGYYQLILRGASMSSIVKLGLAMGVLDWVLEMTSAQLGVINYYGNNPSLVFGLPLYSMVQNIGVYVLQAIVVAMLVPHLMGWRQVALLPVIPGVYLAYAFGCTWPAYMAVQSQTSALVAWPLIIVSVILNGVIPLAALSAYVAHRDHKYERKFLEAPVH